VTNGHSIAAIGTTVKKKIEKDQPRRLPGAARSLGQAFPSPDIISSKEPPPPEKTGLEALTVI
jgi:hypothetical protein